jgi:hypothetical protein
MSRGRDQLAAATGSGRGGVRRVSRHSRAIRRHEIRNRTRPFIPRRPFVHPQRRPLLSASQMRNIITLAFAYLAEDRTEL